jgi:hypothetical protein
MEQRKYERVRVEYAASFSGPTYRAQGTILNLSMVGCRARSTHTITKDDSLGMLIDVPRYEHPLYISRAEVRWSDGQDFGMEFIHVELEDRQRLAEIIRTIEAGPRPEQ